MGEISVQGRLRGFCKIFYTLNLFLSPNSQLSSKVYSNVLQINFALIWISPDDHLVNFICILLTPTAHGLFVLLRRMSSQTGTSDYEELDLRSPPGQVLLCLKTEAEPASETSYFLVLEGGQSPKKRIASVKHVAQRPR